VLAGEGGAGGNAVIEALMPQAVGRSRPWRDHRQVVEGIVFRYRTAVSARADEGTTSHDADHEGVQEPASRRDMTLSTRPFGSVGTPTTRMPCGGRC